MNTFHQNKNMKGITKYILMGDCYVIFCNTNYYYVKQSINEIKKCITNVKGVICELIFFKLA